MSKRLSVAILCLATGVCACSGNAKIEANASVNNKGAKGSGQLGGDETWDSDDQRLDATLAPPPEAGRSVEGHDRSTVVMATFPGFRMVRDGTSRVFLEVSDHVEVAEQRQPALLTYRFAGVIVPERVNRLQLPTSHFESPVTLVRVIQVEGAAELRIHLRQPTDPKTRLKRSAGGTVLSVDFPKLAKGVHFKTPPAKFVEPPEETRKGANKKKTE